MCDPITIAAIAATVGGNYMQTKANNSSVKNQYAARHNVMMQGLEQQQQHQDEANSVLQPTVAGFTPEQQGTDLGAIVTKRSDAINANSTPSPVNSNFATAPKVIQSDLADRMGKAAGFSKQQGDALGRVGATNDQALNNALNVNNAGLKIGTISDFSRADKGVNAAQQNEAFNNARKSPSGVGSALSDIGTLLGLYSFAGGSAEGLADKAGIGPGAGAHSIGGSLASQTARGPISSALWG